MWPAWHVNAALFALLHAGAALACVVVASQKRRGSRAQAQSNSWWWCAGLLLLLGADTLWRLEDVWLASWRAAAQHGAWYAQRGAVQMWVLVGLAAGGLVVLAALALVRRAKRPARLTAALAHQLVRAGLALLCIHLALRVVSWHATDQIIYTRVAMISLGRWLDLLGLGLVVWGAWRQWRMR